VKKLIAFIAVILLAGAAARRMTAIKAINFFTTR